MTLHRVYSFAIAGTLLGASACGESTDPHVGSGGSGVSNTATATTGMGGGGGSTGAGGSGGDIGSWPNEPAGLDVLSDQPWSELVSFGWNQMDRETTSRIVRDPTAPASAPDVLEMVYPAGYPGLGVEPAVDWLAVSAQEIYFAFYWKASPNWDGHPSQVNKIAFMWPAAPQADILVAMYGPPGGPYEIRTIPEGFDTNDWHRPNSASVPIAPDTWYLIEWYFKLESAPGQNDGVDRFWVNGQLVGDYTAVDTPDGTTLIQVEFAPTWGGVQDVVKAHDDYFRFDDTRVSGK